MSAIRTVELAGIFDSRGRPTVEATVFLESGAHGRAGAPSGASTGTHEVRAFPAGGVAEALSTFSRWVAPRLVGLDGEPSVVDAVLAEIDGTADFEKIGGNTATAASVASAVARAQELGRPLFEVLRRPGVEGLRIPAVVGNCLNGVRLGFGGPVIHEFLAFG